MPDVQVPNFGALLAPFISAVPPEAMPRFLALLERGAAERYRQWAVMLPDHAGVLSLCADSEDEIADRVEQSFALDPTLLDVLHAPLPAATATYYEVFEGMDVWDQLRVQAAAERQGAQAWRNIASRITDADVLEQLETCSQLEEASAERLDDLIAAHASA